MSFSRMKFFAALAAVLLLAGAGSAHAFGLTGIGGRIGAMDPDGGDGTLAGAAHLDFEESGSRVHLQPNVFLWGEGGLNDVNPNLDGFYHFNPAGRVSPYVGAGVGVHFYNSDGPGDPGTDLGVNLLAGVLFPSGRTSFFAEGRYVASDRSQLGLYGGVTVPLHH